MTPEKLRQLADELDQKAEAAFREGKGAEGALLSEAAEEARALAAKGKAKGLPVGNTPSIMSGRKVTAAQLKRRGAAVARGWAAKGGSPVSIAIASSKWGNLTRYAKERLKISQPALSRYISGGLPCPRFVAAAVKADFDLDDSVWPKGVVD